MELLKHLRSELGSAKFEALDYDELKLNKKYNTLDSIQVSTRRIKKPLSSLKIEKTKKNIIQDHYDIKPWRSRYKLIFIITRYQANLNKLKTKLNFRL